MKDEGKYSYAVVPRFSLLWHLAQVPPPVYGLVESALCVLLIILATTNNSHTIAGHRTMILVFVTFHPTRSGNGNFTSTLSQFGIAISPTRITMLIRSMYSFRVISLVAGVRGLIAYGKRKIKDCPYSTSRGISGKRFMTGKHDQVLNMF
ncbi:hypothetical protein ACFX2I_036214 [Malus domestica]